jgi:hypothetical protein
MKDAVVAVRISRSPRVSGRAREQDGKRTLEFNRMKPASNPRSKILLTSSDVQIEQRRNRSRY